ncbi:hypothetical protein PC121_g20867 [Phytophthora cactorum]|nr:hypothetical protein PC120_g22541 [Phytophthora cactorum]KAG3046147.1 hypothetical protein PC121_g20867 [Phytophthora cactorum]KAG4041726.1 hypothetical protein PC123_g22771 [Phytophthora cactorum]
MITLERTLSVGTARFKASWNFSLILKNSSQDTTGAPTIDDVFHAIENNDIQSGKGEALTTIPLPDLFDKEKLALLKVVDSHTSSRSYIQNGIMPKTRRGH